MTFSKNTLVNIIAIFLLGILAAVVIFYKFNIIPPMMNKDEEEFAKLAIALEGKPYIPYSPLATGHATLYFYVILFSFQLFGFNELALRLPAATFGLLNIFLFYALMKHVFTTKFNNGLVAASLATFTLITTRWYINFSRFGFEATFLLFLELLSTLSIFRYKETKQIPYLIASGIFAGLAFNSYTPGRIFFLLPMFILLTEVTFKKFDWRQLKPLGIFLISFGIIILPLTIYLSQNSDTRVYQQFFITNEKLSVMTRLTYLGQNILNSFTMLFFKGDVNGIHNYPYKPALNPLIGLLFISGIIISFLKWGNIYAKYFLLFFIVSIIPTWFTYPWENPNMLRTFTVLPAIVYFAGTAMAWIIQKVTYKRIMIVLLMIVLMSSAFYELRTYFMFQSEVFKDIFTSSLDFEFFRQQD